MKLSITSSFSLFWAMLIMTVPTGHPMPLPDKPMAIMPTGRQANQLLHSIHDAHAATNTHATAEHGVRRLVESDLVDYWMIHPSATNPGNDAILVRISASDRVEDANFMLLDLLATNAFVATSKCSIKKCWGWLDLDAIDVVETLASVRSIWPEMARHGRPENTRDEENDSVNGRRLTDTPNGRPIVSEAVAAMQVDKVQASYGDALNTAGNGIKIGVLSDSFDYYGGGQDAGIASGNLPAKGVTVLKEFDETLNDPLRPPTVPRDEGRAMMELIHDIVPQADLYFHTAMGGAGLMAQGIRALADAGCDVIVDDVGYNDDPWFEYGDVAAAANEVAEFRNVAYFSAAGNSGHQGYHEEWQNVACPDFVAPPGAPIFPGLYSSCHDFGGGKSTQRITASAPILIVLQWDEPFGNCQNDLDALVFAVDDNAPPGSPRFLVNAGSQDNLSGGDPLEIVFLPAGTYDLALALFDGTPFVGPSYSPPTLLQWRNYADDPLDFADPPLTASTITGQANTRFTAGVGAYYDQQTLGSGVEIEPFSSRGGTPILFDSDGDRLADPLLLEQPRFLGPDGSLNSFFGWHGQTTPSKPMGHRFFGTSASAPNVAAVAGLLKGVAVKVGVDVTPLEMYHILESTAIDVLQQGFDFDSGHGMVNALAAVERVLDMTDGKVTKDKKMLAKLPSYCVYTNETIVKDALDDDDSTGSGVRGGNKQKKNNKKKNGRD